ncbi:PAS-domain containing protein [Loktanella sp. SALINAS62]|uniref:PAS domain-containing protein n=1 Tax=Loktanella sp. SALINAS62 TaxID=2706124 RepID=UPI001B8BA89D|nr:PAS-domain containing protein [Loktanella sp. SALINAS62]MBS1302427.1 PAS domain-containing protein [Loktanella sp. SALINAS62]
MLFDSVLAFMAGCLFLTGITALFFYTRTGSAGALQMNKGRDTGGQAPVFLFDRDFLIDASPSGSALIGEYRGEMGDLDALFHVLGRQFPTLRDAVSTLGWNDEMQVPALQDDAICIQLKNQHGLTRISLETVQIDDSADRFGALERAAQAEELHLLRSVARQSPQLIWQESVSGNLIWANAAYLDYAERTRPDSGDTVRVWPGTRLFTDLPLSANDGAAPFRGRLSVRLHGEAVEHWFDITATSLDGSTLFYANCANDTVRAENTQREYLQTLAKTFAQLSTGLVIFDRERKLTMFNPAFIDMFGLPVQFVAARPTLEAVLDRLRNMRMLPEPKNYLSWRDQFRALDRDGGDGAYAERWDLPDGQTFRVSGRPHPNGAMALLFEDISAEVSLTRRFRVEIETGQSVLDALPDAIAVFSDAQTLIMTNTAYGDMWGERDSDKLDLQDLRAALRRWKSRSAPSEFWRQIEAFGQGRVDRPRITDEIALLNGRRLRVDARPIACGMMMVRFHTIEDRATLGAVKSLPDQSSKAVGR